MMRVETSAVGLAKRIGHLRKPDVRRDSADVKTVMLVKEHRALSLAVDLGAAAIILINVATLVLATTTPATISHPTVPPSQSTQANDQLVPNRYGVT
jgi:hypothetical protein